MKVPCLLAFSLLAGTASTAAAQSAPVPQAGSVPISTTWPPTSPEADSTTPTVSVPDPSRTFGGAFVGSFVGLLGGGYLGYAMTKGGGGDYDGAGGAVYGGVFAATIGSAGLATATSGIPSSEVFSRAFGGAFLGALAGAGGGMIVGGLTDSGVGWLVGWALGQGTATTVGVLTGDYADAR